MIKKLVLLIITTVFLSTSQVFSQIIIDEIIVILGDEMIKQSDVQNQVIQLKKQGNSSINECELLEDLLFEKLLINRAKIDSIEVTNAEVDAEINRRIDMFVGQAGSFEKIESFYGKTELEIKAEWRPLIYNQMLAQKMQNKIIGDVSISPNEVRTFYTTIPTDSLPLMPIQYEFAQIVFMPKLTKEDESEIIKKLETIRERAIKGESFSKLAVLYSDDPESAKNGGLLGDYMSRGELVPEFSAVAFNLKENEISRVVKTEYGYHIIQLVELKGEKAKIKHILLRPKFSPQALQKSKQLADSVYLAVKDTLPFAKAAMRYSDDSRTKNNGGIYLNPYTGSSKFTSDMIEPTILYTLSSMKPGDISKPFLSYDESGRQVYKIIMLISVTPEHKASLTEDYDMIKEYALSKKKEKVLKEWILEEQEKVFIKFTNDSYKTCKFEYSGWIK